MQHRFTPHRRAKAHHYQWAKARHRALMLGVLAGAAAATLGFVLPASAQQRDLRESTHQQGVIFMADDNNSGPSVSASSSASSSSSSSSATTRSVDGQNGDCTLHADAIAEANGQRKSDHVDKVVKNSDGSCSATARATARSPGSAPPPADPSDSNP